MDEIRWMTAVQAAQYLQLARGTLYNMVSQRRIPYCKRGGILRFEREALDRWLQRGRNAGRAGFADI